MQLLTSLCCSVCVKMVYIIVMYCPGKVPLSAQVPSRHDSFVVFVVLRVMAHHVNIHYMGGLFSGLVSSVTELTAFRGYAGTTATILFLVLH